MQFHSLLTIICLGLLSCNQDQAASTEKTIALVPLVEETIEAETIEEAFMAYPLDFETATPTAVKIVRLGLTHEAESPANLEKMSWLGLYQLDSVTAILKQVSPIKSIVFDAVVDEDSTEKTGVQIDLAESEGLLAIMHGPDYLKTASLTTPYMAKREIMVGEKQRFEFEGKTYELRAEGKQDSLIAGWDGTTHYKLYLAEILDGKTMHTTLLVSTLFFQEAGIRILFMGDLDNDQKLDLLIETSNKYSYAAPAIYLSSFAARNELVKMAGLSIFTSC
ncbi:hypothetical protein DNU06_15690 [Putridiphycobacter roseus]|uniref:Uncharacterized protein n=1 Tax=Putridiphycobacter roseus TaxID=2219161 RepID=A0A2W1NMX0_9FLAO|nr:hypothetical protein [Putridiphycobacter roseus]PZE15948.1 hypothetical protein DNU06_15690 [Putridiphycobacter roseus]